MELLQRVVLFFFVAKSVSSFQARYGPFPQWNAKSRLKNLLQPLTSPKQNRLHSTGNGRSMDLTNLREWTITDILAALDKRSIRYSVSSTRGDLERLLKSSFNQREWTPTLPNQRRRREQRRMSSSNSVVETSSDIFQAGVRQARRLQRQVSDAWSIDPQTGVRTVRYTKRTRDPRRQTQNEMAEYNAIDITNDTVPKRSNYPPRQSQPHPRSRRRPLSTNRPRTRRTEARSNDFMQENSNLTSVPTGEIVKSPGILLPQINSTDIVVLKTATPPLRSRHRQQYPRSRRRARRRDPSKPIFSPYSGPYSNPQVPESIGEWMSQATDRVWPESGERHWKDNWEERVDKLLGIESKKQAYNRWAEEHRKCNSDQQPKRRRVRGPLAWVDLLTGRDDGRSISMDHLLERVWQTGSVLSLAQLIGWTAIRYYSSACRWACVGGALPQPVVALLVAAVGISSRRHRLLWTAGSFLAFRALGEAFVESGGGSFEYNDGNGVDDSESCLEDNGSWESDDSLADDAAG